jgi:O-antigen/teichoic acid export membrane protein
MGDTAGGTPPASLTRHVGVSALGQLVMPLSALVAAPILARVLGVEGRGELAAAVAPMMLAATLATVGMPDALTYFVARRPEVLRGALRFAGLLGTVAGILTTALIVLLAPALSAGDSGLATMMTVASIAIVPALGVAALRGAAAGLHQWGSVTLERSIGALLRTAGLVLLALVGWLDPLTAVLVTAYSPLLGALAYLPLRREARSHAPSVKGGELLGYGGRVWAGAVAGLLLSRLDQVLMTVLAGSHELGLYSVAVNVSDVPLILTGAITGVIFTAEAKLGDNARLHAAARVAGLLSLTTALLLILPMAVWLPWVFSQRFADATLPAAILLLASVAGTPGSLAGAALSARGNPGLRSISLLVACAVNVLLLLWMAPALGAVGAALAMLAGNLLAAYGNILLLWRRHGVPPAGFLSLRRSDLVLLAGALRGAVTRSQEVRE